MLSRALTISSSSSSRASPIRLSNFVLSYSSITSSHALRSHLEDSRNVKVSVWWDFENCHIPLGINVFMVANRIVSAVRGSGIRGQITITGFGDVSQLSRSTQEALTATGVTLNHVPNCGKNSSDKSFMADLAYWVFQNPPPVHFFLITGDSDFACILHRLRMSNYNILLAGPKTAQPDLCSVATIMWSWPNLVKGEESLTVKHFNYPPDGLYGSWYGHYKGVLDDPFDDTNQVASSQVVESGELNSQTKDCEVPKDVIDAISRILHSCPEGMFLSVLHARLEKDNVSLGKDYFGHNKFSQLLTSLPDLVKVTPAPKNRHEPVVCLTDKLLAKSLDLSLKPVEGTGNGAEENGIIPSGTCQSTPLTLATTNSSLEFSPSSDCSKDSSTNNSILTEEHDVLEKHESSCSRNDDVDASVSASTYLQEDGGAGRDGLLRRMLRTLSEPWIKHANGEDDTKSETDSPLAVDLNHGGHACPKKMKMQHQKHTGQAVCKDTMLPSKK